jgi:hypothetical protein
LKKSAEASATAAPMTSEQKKMTQNVHTAPISPPSVTPPFSSSNASTERYITIAMASFSTHSPKGR